MTSSTAGATGRATSCTKEMKNMKTRKPEAAWSDAARSAFAVAVEIAVAEIAPHYGVERAEVAAVLRDMARRLSPQ